MSTFLFVALVLATGPVESPSALSPKALLELDPRDYPEYFDEVIKLTTKLIPVAEGNAKADLLQKRGTAYFLASKTEDALHDLEQARKTILNDPQIECTLAKAMIVLGRHQDAKALMDNLLKVHPKCASAYFVLASICGLTGDEATCLQHLDKALEVDCNYAAAYSVRAAFLGNRGKHREALEDINKALALDPNGQRPAELYSMRGAALAELHRYDEALSSYRVAVRLDDEQKNSHIGICIVHQRIGKRVLAADLAMQMYKKWPDESKITATVIGALTDAENIDQAMEIVKKAPKTTWKDADAAREAGKFCWIRKDYSEANTLLRDSLALEPNNRATQSVVAMFLSSCKDAKFRNGKAALQIAKTLCETSHWKDPHALAVLSAAHAETGDFEKAGDHIEQALLLGRMSLPERTVLDFLLMQQCYNQRIPYRAR